MGRQLVIRQRSNSKCMACHFP